LQTALKGGDGAVDAAFAVIGRRRAAFEFLGDSSDDTLRRLADEVASPDFLESLGRLTQRLSCSRNPVRGEACELLLRLEGKVIKELGQANASAAVDLLLELDQELLERVLRSDVLSEAVTATLRRFPGIAAKSFGQIVEEARKSGLGGELFLENFHRLLDRMPAADLVPNSVLNSTLRKIPGQIRNSSPPDFGLMFEVLAPIKELAKDGGGAIGDRTIRFATRKQDNAGVDLLLEGADTKVVQMMTTWARLKDKANPAVPGDLALWLKKQVRRANEVVETDEIRLVIADSVFADINSTITDELLKQWS
jgi:hypothetical protein